MARSDESAQRELDLAAVQRSLWRVAHRGAPPWLHVEVARRMAERLALIRLQPQWLIDWWGFTGAGAALLERRYPRARRVVVEPTAALLERSLAESRLPWWSPRRWRRADVQVLREGPDLPRGAPLLWSNMMLHAERDPPALFARWHELLQVDGFVMFSCLGPGSLLELRRLYQQLGWPPPAPAFVDMHDLGDMLVRAGFADPVMDQETLTLHWAGAPALLEELRTLGANAAPDRFAALRTPRWRARLLNELHSLAGPDGRLRLSFEVAYGHAFKAAPRAPAGTTTSVPLQEMRAKVRSRGSVLRPSHSGLDRSERG
jgi:malonyl-CoA O-methyltransferase